MGPDRVMPDSAPVGAETDPRESETEHQMQNVVRRVESDEVQARPHEEESQYR